MLGDLILNRVSASTIAYGSNSIKSTRRYMRRSSRRRIREKYEEERNKSFSDVILYPYYSAMPKINFKMLLYLESKPSEGEILPTTDWIDIKDECVNLARKQIRMEFEAALAYFQLGAYFSQYDTNRPGFAKFFFDASTEERSHAIKVFDYLLMRGQLTTYHPDPQLHTLLMMVDWLITDLLDEQLRGQRELAGRISTLYKMKEGYGVIADFLYDKKLLEELNSKAA
ncbi:unnamed protein product [Nesidiocoris tenuis]|uniref:Ferritin n=1 Tax=Nesidiocoris tenuis TaxID=355587 RepID=A0A6H5G2V8_9HEMI|nr:unnamed protein product [Nesidiocoris tenuis]